MRYELVVIGSGPAGEKAAVKAAYFNHRVALVEKASVVGGAGANTGTLPSKTLKETALYLSGKYDKGLYGINRDLANEATVDHFLYRKNLVVESEREEVRKNLLRHRVDLYHGIASFDDPKHIRVRGESDVVLEADHVIIATGSYPVHPPNIPFDQKRIHDSDSILEITRFPGSIAVVGAGVIGFEYATIFSTMGAKVYLINRSDKVLSFVDQEIVHHLLEQMKKDQVELRFNTTIKSLDIPESDEELIRVTLNESENETMEVDMFLFAAGRNGNIADLNLKKIGIEATPRETIPVNAQFQTVVPNIYAVGDVIGFPALASISMDQGRVAVAHIFQTKDIEMIAKIYPYGIYTVPEISMAGLTEEEAKKQNVSYATGVARHSSLPRGKIMGATSGLLKLVFSRDDLVIKGVHIIGALATELIHHGVDLIEHGATLHDVIAKVYNFPTLHDLYKYAAYDGLGTMAGHKVKV